MCRPRAGSIELHSFLDTPTGNTLFVSFCVQPTNPSTASTEFHSFITDFSSLPRNLNTMGCWSHRRPHVEVRPEQKWDYIVSRPGKRPG